MLSIIHNIWQSLLWNIKYQKNKKKLDILHCSILWLPYPTDLCFLRIPLCPPHQAAHIPMSRHFFHFSVSDPACNHRNRSYYGSKRIKIIDPSDRFQVFIVLTIRVLWDINSIIGSKSVKLRILTQRFRLQFHPCGVMFAVRKHVG